MRQATNGQAWRIVRRGMLGLGVLIVVLAAAGAIYNAVAIHRLRQAYPPPGKLYTVDGRTMHLYCTGTGSPTVVLESGHAESFLVWGKVQPALSQVTRVCSYDRAGLGWSEEAPGPRDSIHIADQLHALLASASIDGPLILMGHSGGGTHIRVYASRFRKDVAGLVFVDAHTPPPKGAMPASMDALDEHSRAQFALFQTMIALGIPRALGQCWTPPPGFDATANLWRADACRPSYVTAVRRENDSGAQSVAEAASSGPFGDLPVLVFSRDPDLPRPPHLPSPVSAADWRQGNLVHDKAQEGLKHLSTRSRRIIAKGSGHYIHFERPQLLVREVSGFVAAIRSGHDQPGRGTTVTE